MVDGQTIGHSEELCSDGTQSRFVGAFGNGTMTSGLAAKLVQISKPMADRHGLRAYCRSASKLLLSLTKRQRQILDLVVEGAPSKNIASDLGISQRTVEAHRHEIAIRTGAKNLSALVRIANCGRCIIGAGNDRQPFGLAQSRPAFSNESNVSASTLEQTVQLIPDESRSISVDLCELQHRMKNMMAVIQSLARQSMRESGSKDEFFEQFSGRLTSYSKSVDMLVANRWQGLQIHELIRCQLAAFGVRDGGQVQIDGPELRLSTIGAHNLSLAVHELATNAVKYGALSLPTGRVILAWSIFSYRGEDCFGLHWQEFSGPSVIPPTHRGFGRRIVEDLVPSALGGHATHAFGADGVSWRLIAPTSSALA